MRVEVISQTKRKANKGGAQVCIVRHGHSQTVHVNAEELDKLRLSAKA